MLMNLIYELLNGKINPAIEIIDAGKISIFDQELVKRTKGDVSRILNELNMVNYSNFIITAANITIYFTCIQIV